MRQCSIFAFHDAIVGFRMVKGVRANAFEALLPFSTNRHTSPATTMSFALLSNNTFLKAPVATGSEAYAAPGAAWDRCVTNRPGARFGPRAICEASHMLCDGSFLSRHMVGSDGDHSVILPLLRAYKAWFSAIRSRLAVHGNLPAYLRLDIDCLDPAFAPGSGTPEPGAFAALSR